MRLQQEDRLLLVAERPCRSKVSVSLLQSALQHGHRGLPGGATLARLLRAHRRPEPSTGAVFPSEDPSDT